MPTQMGICGFKYQDSTLEWFPFNFYIYPFEHHAFNRTFVSDIGSLSFLAKHNFDFNKWINEGIGFIAKGQVENYYYALQSDDQK